MFSVCTEKLSGRVLCIKLLYKTKKFTKRFEVETIDETCVN